MAWRNVWRNRRRTALTIAAITFAAGLLVFMLSFQFGSYDVMIDTAVRIRTGHLQVQSKKYHDKHDIRLVVNGYEEVGKALGRIPAITDFTFRANAFSLVSSEDRTYGAMVVGIDPNREAAVSTLSKIIRQGAYFSIKDTTQALVGELLAKNLHVTLGDELTILGQGRDGSIAATVVTVKGIYRSGQPEFDRNSIHIPLAHFQEVYTMGDAVHEVTAVCSSLKAVAPTKDAVATAFAGINSPSSLVVLDWMELIPGLAEGIALDLVSGLIMYCILIMVVAFSILNTFLMAVFERTREFGVLMAIGISPGKLTKLLFLEASIMTVMGVILGIIVGSLVTWYFQVHGLDLSGSSEILAQFGISGRLHPKLTLLSAAIGPAAVLFITIAAALYPALKVRRLQPVEAMNAV